MQMFSIISKRNDNNKFVDKYELPIFYKDKQHKSERNPSWIEAEEIENVNPV